MFSSAFGAYQSDCPVLKIDVSIHVASPMIVYENHDLTKRIFTSTTKSSNVKPPYFCAATITSFRIAVAYSSSIHVNCSAQPIATLSLQLLLVFIIVSEFRPIQGVAKIYVAEKTLRRRASPWGFTCTMVRSQAKRRPGCQLLNPKQTLVRLWTR